MSVTVRAAGRALADAWGLTGRLVPLGAGLINDTWLAQVEAGQRCVLQRLNPHVFPDPRRVMDNVTRVTKHLSAHAPGLVPELLATRGGRAYHEDSKGDCWRLWRFIADAVTRQGLENPAQAESAGRTFAQLHNALADLPGPPLQVPIEGFMRLGFQLQALERALGSASTGDADVLAACARVHERRALANTLQQTSAPIHGDCKVNNLLFRGDDAVHVLDLDTVMVGHWAWDLGDLIRSGANVNGDLSVDLFVALARGFARAARRAVDAESVLLAPRYVGVMLATRFLADHLSGDVYFRVRSRGENLQRGLAQLALVDQLERREGEIRARLAREGIG